ncbi:MAG: DUF4276 family protein [Leptothrix sp. (in: b-proteobacteria)]
MKRLAISAEGATEREFVNRILAPHLRQHGWTAVVGVDLGGNVSLDKIRGVLPGLLGSFDQVSTLYDYYGFRRRGDLVVEALETQIGALPDPAQRHRLLPYVQLHEFEALLFAVPEQTCSWLDGTPPTVATMQAAVREKGSPEQVNDRVETSPSHRLKTLFPRFDKKLHGPDIIELAGLPAVRAGCPRFDAWISRLEQLGMAGG